MILFKRYQNSPGFRISLKLLIILICLKCVSGNDNSSEIDTTDHEDDHKLKNYKLMGVKILPDLSYILKILPEEVEYKYVKQFVTSRGFALLEADGYIIREDIQFTLIIPKIDMKTIDESRLKDFILAHIVPGVILDAYNYMYPFYGNALGHRIVFNKGIDKNWAINGNKIIRLVEIDGRVLAIAVDGYLNYRKTTFSKRNIQETNRYNEPQRLEMKNATTKNEPTSPAKDIKLNPLMTFLSSMKSGTKVFQHFLSKSNLTQILDDGHYTILIPSDNAFQRWHPIDWGFYPFSVHEFTENVMRNHFLQSLTPLRMNDVRNSNKLTYKTLGGETVVFKNNPSPTVNNVSILGDYTLANGNQVFIISEVLFVSEAVVSKLHQMHKDKETPPLLAFPWFGAQFLSHSFLALERDPRFTQITRYLNNAEIAPYISGANFTFFVPEDEAFERIAFDLIPDDILASPKGVKMLLHHFVKGRLYDRDLKDNEIYETIGGGVIKIQRKPGSNVTVNMARITESEVFVYNLGTMFYIDDILYSDILKEYTTTSTKSLTTSSSILKTTTTLPITTPITTQSFESSGNGVTFNKNKNIGNNNDGILTSPSQQPPLHTDVEIVPNEFITEQSGEPDILLPNHDEDEIGDDEIITPKALPIRFNYDLPK